MPTHTCIYIQRCTHWQTYTFKHRYIWMQLCKCTLPLLPPLYHRTPVAPPPHAHKHSHNHVQVQELSLSLSHTHTHKHTHTYTHTEKYTCTRTHTNTYWQTCNELFSALPVWQQAIAWGAYVWRTFSCDLEEAPERKVGARMGLSECHDAIMNSNWLYVCMYVIIVLMISFL